MVQNINVSNAKWAKYSGTSMESLIVVFFFLSLKGYICSQSYLFLCWYQPQATLLSIWALSYFGITKAAEIWLSQQNIEMSAYKNLGFDHFWETSQQTHCGDSAGDTRGWHFRWHGWDLIFEIMFFLLLVYLSKLETLTCVLRTLWEKLPWTTDGKLRPGFSAAGFVYSTVAAKCSQIDVLLR